MSRRRRSFAAAVAVAVAAGLTACGGGGGVSRSDFIAKADKACGTGNGMLAIAAKPSSLPELGTAAGTVAASVDSQAAAIRDLKAPKEDTAAITALVATFTDVSTQARTLQGAAGKTDDAATARAANDLRGKADAAADQSKAFGLTVCGQGLQAPVVNVIDGARTVLKAAFVARAESLCTAANRKADALAGPTSLASAARYLAAYVPIEEKLFADIRALVVPPGDDSAVADMLAAQDKVIAKDKEALAAAQRGNQALFTRLDDEQAGLVTAANSKFDDYGLRACGTLSSF